MKWGDVIITTPQGRKRGEGARSWFANAYPTRIAGTKLKHSVALKKADSTTTVNNDELKLIFRSLLNNNVAFGDEPAPVLPQVANAHRGNAPNVIVRPAPELLMYMNGLRRLPADADPLIDDVPTRNQNWEWGVNRLGAILTVKTRVYQNGAEVKERSLLRIVWRNDYAANWQATLAVDHAGRIRIFRTKLEGGALLLGDTEAGPLLLHNDVTLSQALQAQQSCDLWMEAIDFPETATEADWLVTLTLTFQLNAVNTNQSAVQRIAPWIMGSDLDETFRFYVRTTAGAPDDLSTAVLNFGATAFPIDAGQPKKGYARDVMKSGYSAGPHYSSVVVQGRLDDIAALQLLANTAAQDATGGVIVKPRNRGDLSGQDNGGNLLVSPPTDAYPWGRILFGGTDAMPCQSGAFYTAQKVQRPIRLNSTWLRVGHVDEMLSIVRRITGVTRRCCSVPAWASLC
ncbi:MAG: protein-arginine deiminase family protein [Ignavibacteriota bacterium]